MRAVNGKDQLWLNENSIPDGIKALLYRCTQSALGRPLSKLFFDSLDSEDLKRIDSAIQSIGPDVDCTLQAKCPHCKIINEIAVDPYWLGKTELHYLDNEVHTLAFNYHWSEKDILSLTRERRRTFLKLIDKDRESYV